MAQSVRQFLYQDALAEIDHRLAAERVRLRLDSFLPPELDDQLGVLAPFVDDRPWRYWSPSTVGLATALLEKDAPRAYHAVSVRTQEVDRALHALFTPSEVVLDEGSLPHAAAQSYLRLATDHLPAYLRQAEHVFGNLLSLYWSVARNGGVDAKFRLRNAVEFFLQGDSAAITDGYDDSVRNAIAHGEVRFTGVDVEFGAVHPTKLSPSECLNLLDRLVRTSNALAVGLILFWLRNPEVRQVQTPVPLALAGRLAAGALGRPDIEVVGVVESQTPLVGRQLHVAVKLGFRKREWVMGEASRIAARLIDAGAHDFDRYLVEVDQGGR